VYYNHVRPHQGIEQQIPDWYEQDYPLTTGPTIATPVLNGLHHNYSRAAYLHWPFPEFVQQRNKPPTDC
jgi:hypothetical protein